MSRKFVTDRKLSFINSISRELHQHVVDEQVYYYSIANRESPPDDLYNESVRKSWAAPVRINARVLYDNLSSKAGIFGLDSQIASEIYFHTQELVERNVAPREGDFIEYGQTFYEITSVSQPQLVFGQINNKILTVCKLVPSREGQFQAGGDSKRDLDRSHPVENTRAKSRQAHDTTRATFSLGGSGVPAFSSVIDAVPGQRQLPLYSNSTRPDPTLVSGLEIFNTDAHQEQRSDGAYWRDEDNNIVGTGGVTPDSPTALGLPIFVSEVAKGHSESLPSFSNSTRPSAALVPGLEIFNTDAHQEQTSDGVHWYDPAGNEVG